MSNRWNHLSLICMARQSVRKIIERRIPKEARFCEEIINLHTKNTVRFNEKADSSGSFLLYEEDAPLVFVPSSHGNNENMLSAYSTTTCFNAISHLTRGNRKILMYLQVFPSNSTIIKGFCSVLNGITKMI